MFIKLFLFSILVVFGVFSNVWADNSVGVPDVHIGDLWKYRSMDGYTDETTLEYSHRIIKLDDKEITIQIKNVNGSLTKLQFSTREWNTTDNDGFKFDPFYPGYKFPMNVGVAWKQVYKTFDTHGASWSAVARAKIVAFEKVTVPAGTFEAYRIEGETEAQTVNADANTTKGRTITWYAPAVNKYVRKEVMTYSQGRERSKSVDVLLEYSLHEKSVAQSHETPAKDTQIKSQDQ